MRLTFSPVGSGTVATPASIRCSMNRPRQNLPQLRTYSGISLQHRLPKTLRGGAVQVVRTKSAFLDCRAKPAGDRFVFAQRESRVALRGQSLHESLPMRPRPSRLISPFAASNPRGTSYASPFVLAKGEATGFGGSDRQRIRAASLVASRFDRRRNPSRGEVQIGAVNRVAKPQQLPSRHSRPTL